MSTTTSIRTRGLSPYLEILEAEISSDLRTTIKPEDLRGEVRKALFKEVLHQAGKAMSELDSTLTYFSHDNDRVRRDEIKLSRHLGYVMEMIETRASQRIDVDHQLDSGATESEEL